MTRRWFAYALLGLLFGILDWYFLAILAWPGRTGALEVAPRVLQLGLVILIMAANYGIWLVPAIPAALYENRRSHSIWRAGLAAIVTWSMALVGYYAWFAGLLFFAGLPNLEFMLLSNRLAPAYWADWWPPFKRLIVDQLLEWIPVALAGGALVGAASAHLANRLARRKSASPPSAP